MDEQKAGMWLARAGGHAREKEDKEGQPNAAAPRRVATASGATPTNCSPKAEAQLLPRRAPRPATARRTQPGMIRF